METIAIVCFQWRNGYREYKPEYVNILERMVSRNLSIPYRFICISDETEGFSDNVEVMPLPGKAREIADIKTIEGPKYPSCHRRLWLFSKEAQSIADRIMLLDIDMVVVGDMAPLFEYQDDFIGWRPRGNWGQKCRIGGAIWLLRAGTHSWVWDDFVRDPKAAIKAARSAGYRGSDQAWVSYCLAENCKVFPRELGLYQSQDKIKKMDAPPEDTIMVQFNGDEKPWSNEMQKVEWVKKHWR